MLECKCFRPLSVIINHYKHFPIISRRLCNGQTMSIEMCLEGKPAAIEVNVPYSALVVIFLARQRMKFAHVRFTFGFIRGQ